MDSSPIGARDGEEVTTGGGGVQMIILIWVHLQWLQRRLGCV